MFITYFADSTPRGKVVDPGFSNIYSFTVPSVVGPTNLDPPCLTHVYVSGGDLTPDLYSGLVGPLLVCKKGWLDNNDSQVNLVSLDGTGSCCFVFVM